ncbi:MAG TPA: DUF4388 domain-containing protein [Holophagaceae bacterium]|nr:DUF4388 domain-containing protein [Holophagaceae bacterium]
MSNLKGSLESISLTDVAQLLHVNRKTGLLKVSSGPKNGVLYFVNGEVVNAEVQGAKGEMAAYEILELTSGTFDFQPSTVQMPQIIRRSVQDLLMDSARVSDSRKRLQAMFPNLGAVPWPKLQGDELTHGLKMFAEEKKLLPFFDGFRDFAEIMEATGQNDVAVMQAAAALMEAGRLDVLEPETTLRVTLLKSGFFKKADHLELATGHEQRWKALTPYALGIENLRVIWARGPAVYTVKFSGDVDPGTLGMPKEILDAWELSEGMTVKVRPAP